MAKGDETDDILSGTPIKLDAEPRSRDDGGEEKSDPDLSRPDDDPRARLERESLERETGFDPAAGVPEGKSVDVGLGDLGGLTGPDHDGIGEDDLLTGHPGANSPLDVDRNPLAGDGGDGGAHGGSGPVLGGSGSADPGNNPDLVGWSVSGLAGEAGEFAGRVARFARQTAEDIGRAPGVAYDNFDRAMTKPDETPKPPPETPPPPPTDDEDDEEDFVNPDADTGGTGGVTSGGSRAPVDGGNVDFGEGGGVIQAGGAPPDRHNPVADPTEDGGSTSLGATSSGPTVAPGSEVTRPVNPQDDILGPTTSGPTGGTQGGGGSADGDGVGLAGVSSAATASFSDDPSPAPGAPGITVVGSGAGPGIGSTIASGDGDGDDDPPPPPEDDDPPAGDDLVAGVHDDSIRALDTGDVLGETLVARAPAVATEPVVDGQPAAAGAETFAPPVVEAAPTGPDHGAALAGDLSVDLTELGTGTTADLDGPAFAAEIDPGGADLLEGAPDDLDDLDA